MVLAGAPEQGAHAGGEHGERERLRQVVVGAGVERLRLVEVAIFGGEHEHGGVDTRRTEVAADAEAVTARQQDVEDDEVVAALRRPPEPVVTVGGNFDGEALGFQPALTAVAIFVSSSTSNSLVTGHLGEQSRRSRLTAC